MTGAVVTCSFGKLSRGSTATADLELDATSAGDLRGAFRVSGQRGDPTSGNNSAGTLTSVPGAECTLLGRGGRDKLRGNRGNDYLGGGLGLDRLSGGAGRDRCLSGLRFSC